MKTLSTLVFLLILNLSATNLFAQTSPNNCICPVITMIEPDRILQPGEPAIFTAEIKGDKGQTTYNWTVNAGTIISGQGTKIITVETKDLSGTSVTATVTVGGWCPACENLSASGTTNFDPIPQARLFNKLNNPNCEYRQAVMDAYFTELNNDPSAIGQIFTFGSPRTVAEVERKIRANINRRKFPSDRFVFTNGGKSKKPVIEFWIVPAGADIPKPEPPAENAADFDTSETNGTVKRNPKEPYIFSAEYYDGGACIGEDQPLDLAGYAEFLKENRKAQGKIILMTTTAEFRKKEREILSFLAKKGIARQRLKTSHRKSFGGVELWVLP